MSDKMTEQEQSTFSKYMKYLLEETRHTSGINLLNVLLEFLEKEENDNMSVTKYRELLINELESIRQTYIKWNHIAVANKIKLGDEFESYETVIEGNLDHWECICKAECNCKVK